MRLQIHMQAPSLFFETQVDIIMPQCAPFKDPNEYYSPDNKLPVMFLLHGGGGDRADWLRFANIEILADQYGMVIVCPSAQNSSYMNMAYGYDWAKWIYEELYDYIHAYYPVSDDPAKNFIVGMSMGGYGAFRGALHYPEKYGKCVAFSSGACVPQNIAEGKGHHFPQGGRMMTGDDIIGSENDLFASAERLLKSGRPIPKLLSSCGTEDFTYQENIRFRDHLLSLGYDLKWHEAPGSHDWDYWNGYFKLACDWLFDKETI